MVFLRETDIYLEPNIARYSQSIYKNTAYNPSQMEESLI